MAADNMIHIYCSKQSKRLKYTLSLVFNELLGYGYTLYSDNETFESAQGAKLIYGFTDSDVPYLAAHAILFEKNIKVQTLNTGSYNDTPVLFCVQQQKALLPFDPLAAIFYMVSRYEEYQPHQRDAHQRFSHEDSIACKQNFLQLPVAHLWADLLHQALQEHYPHLQKQTQAYRFTPTYDIDAAWCYKHKGFTRNIGGFCRDALQFNFSALKERIQVLGGRRKDPFNTFNQLINWQKKYKLYPIYFILFGQLGPFDKNISPNHPAFHSLIKDIRDHAKIGIHPSYASNEDSKILAKELKELSATAHIDIIRSRQHFLKLELPRTYRHLLNLGIQHDYTMGYAGAIGFRAGMAQAFYFYDLDLDTSTPLLIHPFMVMDGTLLDYMKVDPETAMKLIDDMIDTTKSVNGEFISLWHNESFSERGRWVGWSDVYVHLLEKATSS